MMLVHGCIKMTDKVCPECQGDGEFEVDVPKRMSFDRDIGYLDTEKVLCYMCDGSGVTEDENENI